MIIDNNPEFQQFVNNETMNVYTPSQTMVEVTGIVCEMIESNMAHIKKNGLTEAAKISRERLLKLLHLIEPFNTIANQNISLRLHNRRLINEINEIKRQEKLANSI